MTRRTRVYSWGVRVGVYLVVADVERVLDDAADQLRREEVGELRGEGRGEGGEVGALVILQASRRAHFLQVSVG